MVPKLKAAFILRPSRNRKIFIKKVIKGVEEFSFQEIGSCFCVTKKQRGQKYSKLVD